MLKYFLTNKAKIDIEDGERAVIATISDSTIDRDNEVVLPKGALLDNYQNNPVVFWSHQSWDPPIAKNIWIKVTPKGLVAKTVYAETEFADEIYQLYKGEFLRAFSVGFESRESRVPNAKDLEKHPEWKDVGKIHVKWELFEYSAVSIGSNLNALAIAVGKGLKVSDELRTELDLLGETKPEELKELEAVVIPVKQRIIPVTVVEPITVNRYIEGIKRHQIPVSEIIQEGITQSINRLKGIV